LGTIFLVGPDILKSYITENYLGRIDPALLQPYLANRSDWGQIGFDETGSTQGAQDNTKNRFGRLSVVMKDFDSLRAEGMKLGEGLVLGMPAMPAMSMPGLTALSTRLGV
jgi:exocyst complex component 5